MYVYWQFFALLFSFFLLAPTFSLINYSTATLHSAGPDKELFQLAVFGELLALFPDYNVHIDFVGPAVPEYRSVTSE